MNRPFSNIFDVVLYCDMELKIEIINVYEKLKVSKVKLRHCVN